MSTCTRRTSLTLFLALLALAPLTATSAVPVARDALTAAGLVLEPLVSYEAAVLTVGGEGRVVFRRSFEPQEPIVFQPIDSTGHPLADGTYRWELRLTTAAPDSVERTSAPALARQSGRFMVRDGAMLPRPAPTTDEGSETVGDMDTTISNEDPSLIFDDTTVGDDDYSIDVDGDVLSVVRAATEEILTVQSGVVGLFTQVPSSDVSLHIATGSVVPSIRLEGASNSWDVVAVTNDLEIRDSDKLFPPTVLQIEDTGSAYELHFLGAGIFEGDFSAGSSRDLKRDLRPAAGDDLLARLEELPLYDWSYRRESSDVRHLGPMAEDFYAAFGLGRDARHLSPGDTAGVALAAIQTLAARLEQRDREITELRLRLEALEADRATD